MEPIDLCDEEEPSQKPEQAPKDEVWIIDDDGDHVEAAGGDSGGAKEQRGAAAGETADSLYLLDCGCQASHSSLASSMQQEADRQLVRLARAGGTAAADAASRLSCPHCGCVLSAQDALKLLGAGSTGSLYAALASAVKQLPLAGPAPSSAPMPPVVAACVQLWREFAALQALLLGSDPPPPAGSGAEAGKPPGKAKRRQQKQPKQASKSSKSRSKSAAAWAAGTGYGGSPGLNKAAQAAMTAAAQRQAAADAAMMQHLAAITAALQDPPSAAAAAAAPSASGPSSSSGVGRKRGRDGTNALAGSLPWPVCGVVLAGPLAWLLRLLCSNDSLLDVVARRELYAAALDLLRHIGSSTDLLPLLELPADDPRDTTPAATSTAAGPSSSSSSSSSSMTLMAALQKLEQQAGLYRRSAEQLMQGGEGSDDEDGEEDMTAAVCLALDVSSLVQILQEGLQLLQATLAGTGALHIKPQSATADTPPPQQPAAAAAGSSQQRRGRPAAAPPQASAAPAGTPAAPSAEAAAAAVYVAAMQPFRFIEADLLGAGHYFARDAAAAAKSNAGGEVMRRRLKRITEELAALSTSLPLSWDSSILLAVHEERLDVLRALLLPHPDTPYGGGAFLFDILLPPEYPDKPPKVQFLTTGEGRWRANPNLYACGKVCLSLLGTWIGPSWEPGVSTLLQVLVSLQSMVLVSDPYFNEPGYERTAATASGKAKAAEYNADIRLGTASHALLAQLRRPDPVFGPAIRLHFSHQRERVGALLQQWVRESQPNRKQQLQEVVRQVQQELNKLPALAGLTQQQHQQQQAQGQGTGRQRSRTAAGRREQEQAHGAGAADDVIDLT